MGMKKIITILLIVLFPYRYVYSQPTNIYTCKNELIEAEIHDFELGYYDLIDIDYALFNSNGSLYHLGIKTSDIIADPTAKYNCHAYAWHLTEGYTNKVWINNAYNYKDGNCWVTNNNLNAYWSGTYACFEECIEADAEKIHYTCGDHSAVKSAVPGKYISKWGSWYVLSHNPTQVPYANPTARKYYKRKTGILCSNSSVQFSINTNSTVTWTYSSNLQPMGGDTGNPKSFNPSSSPGVVGWVRASVNGNVLPQIRVINNNPIITNVSGNTQPLLNAKEMYIIASPNATSYDWSISPKPLTNQCVINYYDSNQRMQVQWLKNGDWTVKGYAYNSCGSTSQNIYVTVSGSGGGGGVVKSFSYPNPVSDILSVEINDVGQGSKVTYTYDICLYDVQGTLVRQTTTKGGTIQFNVSTLPNGIYYLHIYDGVNEMPEIHQIVVEH